MMTEKNSGPGDPGNKESKEGQANDANRERAPHKLKLIQFKAEKAADVPLFSQDALSFRRLGFALAIAAGATVMGLVLALTQKNRAKKA